MLGFDAPLSLGEFVRDEPLPLGRVFRVVLELLAGRTDAVVFGAHAVNAYVEDEKQRMTGDVDVLSTDPRSSCRAAPQCAPRIASTLRCASER